MRRYPTIPASLRSLCSLGKAVGRTRDCRDVMHDDPGCAALTRATLATLASFRRSPIRRKLT